MIKKEQDLNVIGIRAMCLTSDILDFTESGEYSSLPVVVYCNNNQLPQVSYIKKAIQVFKRGMQYRVLRNVVLTDEFDGQFLKIPWRAYNEMQKYIHNNVQKVLADIVTCVIKKQIEATLDERGKPQKGIQNIFFIDTNESAKILGRLGYMYLNNDFNTFVFLTYKADALMTDVLNRKERLEFDLHYFREVVNKTKGQSEIIPNDFRESLIQTVFFNMSTNTATYTMNPLRCDIISQGLTRKDFENKVELIKYVLSDNHYLTPPIVVTKPGKGMTATRIPNVLQLCIDKGETLTMEILLGEE